MTTTTPAASATASRRASRALVALASTSAAISTSPDTAVARHAGSAPRVRRPAASALTALPRWRAQAPARMTASSRSKRIARLRQALQRRCTERVRTDSRHAQRSAPGVAGGRTLAGQYGSHSGPVSSG